MSNIKKSRVQDRHLLNVNKSTKSENKSKINNNIMTTTIVIPRNMIGFYINQLVKSDFDKLNTSLLNDIQFLKFGAYYYPNHVCKKDDHTLFDQILKELSDVDEFKLIKWSKHYKIDNPKCSETFTKIINKVAHDFNVTVLETRLNYYKDGNDWKPLHHDSHAYSNEMREDHTIGISLGDSRELIFMHETSENKFKFPQNNGDVFAFDSSVNKAFLHGITKSIRDAGPRISLIVWGKKTVNRTINNSKILDYNFNISIEHF